MNVAIRAHRVRQVLAHLQAVGRHGAAHLGFAHHVGRAGDLHLRSLRATPRARRAFASAHPADQASATRTAASLRRLGAKRDDQFAALLHDLPKGRVGLIARVLHVLEGSPVVGHARGPWGSSRQLLRLHASAAPKLAASLGAPKGTILILNELARQESRRARDHHPSGIGARARLLLDLDSEMVR